MHIEEEERRMIPKAFSESLHELVDDKLTLLWQQHRKLTKRQTTPHKT